MNNNKRTLFLSLALVGGGIMAPQAQAAVDAATPQAAAGEVVCQDLDAVATALSERVGAGDDPVAALASVLDKMACNLGDGDRVTVALNAGLDPNSLLEVPAAGRPDSPPGLGTGPFGTRQIQLPGITNRGGGGGGGPSPS